MVKSGYLMTFVKITELVGRILLIFGIIAPLGLLVLAPIILNILLFNIVLNPASVLFSLIVTIIFIGLVWNYRDRFMTLFVKENY